MPEEAEMNRQRKKENQKGKVFGTILLLLIVLIGAGGTGLFLYAQAKLSLIDYAVEETDTVSTPVPTIDSAAVENESFLLPERKPEKEDNRRSQKEEKKRIVNILLLGTDWRLAGTSDPGRADVTMLCSLNTKTGAIKLVSFERGIFVPIPGREPDLLTHAYHWGGAELSQSIIEQCFLLDVDGYAQVDFQAFADVIDAIGGIDVELTPEETWALELQHSGLNHLNGYYALRYCRLRAVDDDWGRQARQRTALTAAVAQLRSLSISELNSVANTILPLIHTNLSKERITSLLLSAPKFLNGHIEQLQVPDENMQEHYIDCDFDYESKKISNFLYGTEYEIVSPY